MKNFEKNIFFLWIFLFLLKRSFQGIFGCFEIRLEVPKFKEHVLITVITLIEVRDLLFTLLQVITILVAYFQKFMNTNYSY